MNLFLALLLWLPNCVSMEINVSHAISQVGNNQGESEKARTSWTHGERHYWDRASPIQNSTGPVAGFHTRFVSMCISTGKNSAEYKALIQMCLRHLCSMQLSTRPHLMPLMMVNSAVSTSDRHEMVQLGAEVREIADPPAWNVSSSIWKHRPKRFKTTSHPQRFEQFFKLLLWDPSTTGLDRVVYLDPDTIVIRNISSMLTEISSPAATHFDDCYASDAKVHAGKQEVRKNSFYWNAGVLVFDPSTADSKEIMEMYRLGNYSAVEVGTSLPYYATEQDLLQAFYWKKLGQARPNNLGFKYNFRGTRCAWKDISHKREWNDISVIHKSSGVDRIFMSVCSTAESVVALLDGAIKRGTCLNLPPVACKAEKRGFVIDPSRHSNAPKHHPLRSATSSPDAEAQGNRGGTPTRRFVIDPSRHSNAPKHHPLRSATSSPDAEPQGNRGGTTTRCSFTVSIYPGFQDLIAKATTSFGGKCPVGVQCSQRKADMHILSYFQTHTCLRYYEDIPAQSFSPEPHLYIIPVPWSSIVQGAPHLLAEARKLLEERVLATRTFQLLPHKHVVLYTCTSALEMVYGRFHQQMTDPRIIYLHWEGMHGDARKGTYEPSYRTIVVPYAVDSTEEVQQLASKLGVAMDPALNYSNNSRATLVYLRCSLGKGHSVRSKVVDTFARSGIPGMDVRGLNERLDKQSTKAQQWQFMSTYNEMRQSKYCLIPAGITSSTRRLFESISFGCVPVLLSPNLTFPFMSHDEVARDWRKAVVWHSLKDIKSLPQRLSKISDAEWLQQLAAARALLPSMSYSVGSPLYKHLDASLAKLLMRRHSGNDLQYITSQERKWQNPLPGKLLKDVAKSSTLVVTSFRLITAEIRSSKRQTRDRDLVVWLCSLRKVYEGPVLSVLSGDIPPKMLTILSNFNASHVHESDLDLESITPAMVVHPGVNPKPVQFTANQHRLLAFTYIMQALQSQGLTRTTILVSDMRDVIFQDNPFKRLTAVPLLGDKTNWGFLAVDDCKCKAQDDRYFKKWGHGCIEGSILWFDQQAPVNGGLQFGDPTTLAETYSLAATFASVSKSDQCYAGGRDQHLITAAVRNLQKVAPEKWVVLPNDVSRNTLAFNMGINNVIPKGGLMLDKGTQQVKSGTNSEVISILHQWDRRSDIAQFKQPQYDKCGADTADQ